MTMRARKDKDAAIIDAEIVVDRGSEEPAKAILDVEIVASDRSAPGPEDSSKDAPKVEVISGALWPEPEVQRMLLASGLLCGLAGLALGYWFGQREGRG